MQPAPKSNPFQLKPPDKAAEATYSKVHVYGNGIICKTDSRGQETPGGLSITEIVVDASEGFIPLWEQNSILRWRFQERTFALFEDPDAARAEIKGLFADALLLWGDAAPVQFTEADDAWDFEFVVREGDACNPNGCVLAAAFFPDGGRHEVELYPKMFTQDRTEQVETLVHEMGHVFGLRHFFANISETAWRSEIFGTHDPFSIMNYGAKSTLTQADKDDLKLLYELAWNGELVKINGTQIKFFRPNHTTT